MTATTPSAKEILDLRLTMNILLTTLEVSLTDSIFLLPKLFLQTERLILGAGPVLRKH